MIWDSFLFFDEFDLLEIRLHELDDVVDWFVLLESPRTFTNQEKPLYFREHRDPRFERFYDKLYVVTLPWDGTYPLDPKSTWDVEAYHRNYLMDWLRERAKPDDVIMQSDADEIPSKEFVEEAAGQLPVFTERLAMRPCQWLSWYYLNCLRGDKWTVGTRATTFARLNRLSGEQLRREKRKAACPIVGDGWHFSYMGDIQKKLAAFSHTELNCPPFNDPEHIQHCRENQIDLFGDASRHAPMRIEEDLTFLPEYVQNNLDHFRHLIYEPNTSRVHV